MENLTRRVRRDYAAGISLALAGITLCIGFIVFAIQVRGLDVQSRQALQDYEQRAGRMPPISTQTQFEQLIAGTSYPGFVFSIAEGDKRFIVWWPPGTVSTEPRGAYPPGTPNPFIGLARLAGLQDARAIVNGEELRLLPVRGVMSVAYQTLLIVAIAAALELLLALHFSRRLAHEALRPLHSLHRALSDTAETGSFASPLPEPKRDDLSGLIHAYNLAIEAATKAMAERDAAEERTHQFIADAGHQLRTPLTVLSGFVGILRRGQLRSPDDGPKILEKMEQQLAIIKKLVERMMLLEGWSTDRPSCESVDIGEFVRTIVEPIGIAHPGRTIDITTKTDLNVCIDRSELTYAITNIVANALKYAPESEIRVDVAADAENAVIVVSDDGPGITEEELPNVFNRFYRGSRRDVPGSGLGLAIAQTAVERAGGTIGVRSEPNQGAMFTITLPRLASSAPRAGEVTEVPMGT